MDYVKLGKDPIHADAPTGSDARYEPEFEALQEEIGKLSSPTASGGVDWQKVGDLSAQILAEKSKDLLVASYFAVSQVRAGKMAGLAVGLTVMHDLVANFWDQLFPAKKRMRGRLGAFEWWLEKTINTLEDQDTSPIAADNLEAMITNLDELEALLSEHMPEPPMLIKLKRYLERLPSEAAVSSPVPEADAPTKPEESPSTVEAKTQEIPDSPPEQPSPVASPLAVSPVQPAKPAETEVDPKQLISSGLNYLSRAADSLNKGDWSDARAFRIRRQLAWMNIERLPAATDGRTFQPPPSLPTVQALNDIRAQEEWMDLLMGAEPKVSQDTFWLDLNHMVAEALAGLGSDYQAAYDTVCLETAYFVHRLPGITNLTFATGMPFADAETIAWLKDIAFGAGMAMETPISTASSAVADKEKNHMQDTLQEAQNLVKKKKIVEAIGLLQKEMQKSVACKEIMLWRMSLCQLMVAAKQAPLALPQLELLVESIDRFQLETWDPELALEALKIVWQGYKAQKKSDDQEKAAAIVNRINRLNPVEALGMK
jgi:type VI secretion system protein VasJ